MFMRYKVTVNTSHYPKDVPFEVPEGWALSTINDLFTINPKNIADDSLVAAFVPMASISDGFSDSFKYEERCWRDVKTGFTHFADSDVAVAKISPCLENRKSFVAKALPNGIGAGTTELFVFRSRHILPDYTLLFFKSDCFISACVGTFNGVVGQQRAARNVIEEMMFPIPPVPEQSRIVEKVEELFGEIDEIERGRLFVKANIEAAKSRILDLAIHGKLVPQYPSDEPAIELLKRINPAFKPSDNLHYEGVLPNRWSIIRLGDVIDVISGTSYQKTDIVPTDSGIRILRGGNIQNGMIVLCEDDVFVNHRLSDKHLSLYRGDIALVASTGSRELIGKAAIAKRDYQNTQIGAFLRIIRPKATELSDYLGILFQSDYYKKHIQEAAKGTNINNIKTSYLTEFVVPLPPIKEQQRIIEKVNALFLILNHMANLSDC